jgi:membrane-associated phospholipid phosphatase
LQQPSTKESFFRTLIRVISPTELVTFAFIILILVLTLIFQEKLDASSIMVYSTILLIAIVLVNYARSKSDSKTMRAVHTFYIVPLVLLVFKTVEKLSFALHGKDYDALLISIDRALFGGAVPSVWLFQHIPVMPLFVEIMQLCYFSYYFLPIILAIEFFIRRRHEHTEDNVSDELETLRFIIIYGLLVSYIGYFSLPGIGPRFTVFDFWAISKDLPGIFFTEPMRWFINFAENIRVGMTSAQAAAVVTRDVFPSGHTEIAVLCMILGFRYKAKSRWVILFLGLGLIFSTIYLRYHYVIDLIAGSLLAMVTLYTSAPIMNFFIRLKRKLL